MPTFFHLPVEDRYGPDVPNSHVDLQPVLKECPHYRGVGVTTRLREGGQTELIEETNLAVYLWCFDDILTYFESLVLKYQFFTWNSTSWFGTSWLNSLVTVRPSTVVSGIWVFLLNTRNTLKNHERSSKRRKRNKVCELLKKVSQLLNISKDYFL